MAAPSFRDESTYTRDDILAATGIWTVPALTEEGDLMFVGIIQGDDGNLWDNTPTGFTMIEHNSDTSGTDKRIAFYYKFADADDETNAGTKTYTFTGSSNEGTVVVGVVYSNVNSVVPFAGAMAKVERNNDLSPLGLDIDTGWDDSIVLHISAAAASTAEPTAPTGTTLRSADSINNGGGLQLHMSIADETRATAGSGTAREWTGLTGSPDGFCYTIALTSADEGPTSTVHLTKSNALSPLRQYRFDEGTGTTATDYGSDDKDGSYGDESTSDANLSPTEHTLSEPDWVDDWAGNSESAISVTDQDNEMMDSPLMSDESITVEVIAKWDGAANLGDTQRKQLITQTTSSGDSNDGWFIALARFGTAQVRSVFQVNSGASQYETNWHEIDFSEWTHYVFVLDVTGGHRGYVNGFGIRGNTDNPDLVLADRALRVGGAMASTSRSLRHWEGDIAFVAVYDGDIGDDDIQELYHAFVEERDNQSTTVTPNQAVETDSALALSLERTHDVTQPVETDTAGAVTRKDVTYAVGLATETDTALPASRGDVTDAELALETDTALQIDVERTYAVTQAIETDSALAATAQLVTPSTTYAGWGIPRR